MKIIERDMDKIERYMESDTKEPFIDNNFCWVYTYLPGLRSMHENGIQDIPPIAFPLECDLREIQTKLKTVDSYISTRYNVVKIKENSHQRAMELTPYFRMSFDEVIWYLSSDGGVYLCKSYNCYQLCAHSKAEFDTRIAIESSLYYKLVRAIGYETNVMRSMIVPLVPKLKLDSIESLYFQFYLVKPLRELLYESISNEFTGTRTVIDDFVWFGTEIPGVREGGTSYHQYLSVPPIKNQTSRDLNEIKSPTSCILLDDDNSIEVKVQHITMKSFYSDPARNINWYLGSDNKVYYSDDFKEFRLTANSKEEFESRITIEASLCEKLNTLKMENANISKEIIEQNKHIMIDEELNYIDYYFQINNNI
ncbi:hypothetical protein PPL_03363 [Heterostelium album PN500]|uniref:Uncharacterized protein n=1 Tax=Heterostelium pallidum (strain ATCC 26659 / Pp 5 / PN500) TaxID=670386 RepID=D3B4N8_HETP5|nr:hypothetical protein PPL_03363 [Heterostelium album PN500]EFA84286.1 hypothetical protein PPL_03363 [Heterostelium album PN500]|eukprot:XP_020436402.1 hypothetical protein PPL_03363 [Heterostelium album PN500]